MRAAVAPGKVILTGEHAVVHGGAALAIAIDRHIHALFVEDNTQQLRWKDPLTGKQQSLTREEMKHCVDLLSQRYLEWQENKRPIQRVLEKPSDLLVYTLANALGDHAFPGGDLKWRSNLPIGAGMGSSAAFIAVVLQLFSESALDSKSLLHRVHFCERLQHGKGSLIDASSVTLGGLVRVQQGEVTPVNLCAHQAAINQQSYWIFTGTPEASTGECVDQVRRDFSSSSIWQAFAQVESQWLEASESERSEFMRENHRLLCQLGVVPTKVQELIAEIEKLGGAAKISGAGSIRGDAAGLIIAWLPFGTPDQLKLPNGAYWGALKQENQGAKAFCI